MKKLLLEFLGSFGSLFFGCIIEMFVIYFLNGLHPSFMYFLIAVGFAVSFSVFYNLCNLFSLSSLNPLFTFSLWLKDEMKFFQMISTIFMQALGALLSGVLVSFFFSNFQEGLILGKNSSFFHTTFNSILLTEFITSFVLICVFLFTRKKFPTGNLGGWLLGFFLLLLIWFFIPFTGNCVNPVRGLVSNLFVDVDTFCQLGYYIFSSLAGALFATIIYHFTSYNL